jgi:hypothetical protein
MCLLSPGVIKSEIVLYGGHSVAPREPTFSHFIAGGQRRPPVQIRPCLLRTESRF